MTTLTPQQTAALAARDLFKKRFPNGFAEVYTSRLTTDAALQIGLIGNPADCSGGYRENDLLKGTYRFKMEGDKLVVTRSVDTDVRFYCEPTQPHYAMSTVKIPLRKINNTPEKALAAFEKHVAAIATQGKALIAESKLYRQSAIDPKYLDIL